MLALVKGGRLVPAPRDLAGDEAGHGYGERHASVGAEETRAAEYACRERGREEGQREDEVPALERDARARAGGEEGGGRHGEDAADDNGDGGPGTGGREETEGGDKAHEGER